MAARFRRLQDAQARVFARALDRFFLAQSSRVVQRYLNLTKAVDADDLMPADETAKLRIVVMAYSEDVIVESSKLLSPLVGVEPLTTDDVATRRLLRQAAGRVTDITEATRTAIQDTLLAGQEAHYSARQIAEGVEADGYRGLRATVRETYAGRAATIARTEVAITANHVAADRYRAGGVTEVDISDGPECGWDGHDDPDVADGSRRTLAELEATPTSHANCVRVPYPVLE